MDCARPDYEEYLTQWLSDIGESRPPIVLAITKTDQRTSWFTTVTIPGIEAIADKARDLGFIGVVETSGYYPDDGNLGRAFDKIFNLAYGYG